MIATVFVNVSWNPSKRTLGTTALFERAWIAIELAGPVVQRPLVHPTGRGQELALRTDVPIFLDVIGEVCPTECSIGALAPVPNRNMRVDAPIHEPAQQSAGAVSAIGCNMLRDQSYALGR